MKTNIQVYPDMSQLDNDTLDKIIDHEREVFGYKGYGEYAFCTNPECRRIQSIDEIYGVKDSPGGYKPLEELEKDGCIVSDCPDCNSPSQLIFDPDIYRPYLVSLYHNAYGSILSDETGAVRGTCVAQPTNMKNYFHEIMDYKGSMDWNEFRKKASEILNTDFNEETPVVSTNRVSVSRPFREGGMFITLSKVGANSRSDLDGFPAFASVRYDGNVLPILQAVGYKEIVADEFGTVAIGIEKFGQLKSALNLDLPEFGKQFGPKITTATRSIKTRQFKSPFPKYYRDTPLLDQFQAAAEQKIQNAEFLNQGEISPELLDEISDIFREMFNNEYEQYLFYPSEGKAIPPSEIFGTDEYITLDRLDSLNLSEHAHPETSELPHFWHDPKTVRSRIDHLKDDGQLVSIRNKDKKIEGITYGYHSSIGEAFEREEWENPINYSGLCIPKLLRDKENFISCINNVIGDSEQMTAESDIYVWNQLSVKPEARRLGAMKDLTRNFFGGLAKQPDLPTWGLAEVPKVSHIHDIVIKAGAIEVPGALTTPNGLSKGITLIAFPVKSFIDFFTKDN